MKEANGSMVATRARVLFDMEDELLYAEARSVASRHCGYLEASPIILTGNCTTRPICNHCKWEHFKAVGKNQFALDLPVGQSVERARDLWACGVKRAFCATGWMGYELPARFIEAVAAIHEAIPALELYGLFGALDKRSHELLAEAGLTGMLTGLESPNPEVYRSFRPGGDSLGDRLNALGYAREAGLDVWTGFLVGLGETEDDVARGIELVEPFKPGSMSILPFVPFPDTPMANHPRTDTRWLARANAVARILLPDVRYFFTDHADGFNEETERKLGMNAAYAVGRR